MNGKQGKISNSFLWIGTGCLVVVIIFYIIQCSLNLLDKSFDSGRASATEIGPDSKRSPIAGANLQIRNNGFELKALSSADNPESWNTLSDLKARDADKYAIYSWDNVVKHTGERSVRIKKVYDNDPAGWVQVIPCKGTGKRYQISAWLKTEGINNNGQPPSGANISVIFINRGKMVVIYQTPSIQDSAGWRYESEVIIEPEDCTEMVVSLNLNCKGTTWWDDVSISELPLPNPSELLEITDKELDQYGGWKKIKGKATGFFHTEKIGERWWIITPDGNGYIVKGVQYMPSGEGEKTLPVSTEQRIKDWGFNTVSHYQLFKNLAYDAPASPSLWGFPWFPERASDVRVPLIDTDKNDLVGKASAFPDVFSERFKELLEKEFKITAEKYKNDPWLMGYFTGNELPWEGNPSRSISLFDMFFALTGKREGKKALVNFLKNRYSGSAKGFNEAWGTNIKEFNELLIMSRLRKQTQNAQCEEDKQEFLRLVADTYFRLFYETIRKYDQNHMILGVRFRDCYGTPREVLEGMGNYVDMVSFNCYTLIPPLEFLAESYKIKQKPILISEFSFKAEDSGLPNLIGPGYTFKSQRERALWYERYVSHLLSSPFIVGYIWYKYDDDPPRKMAENSNFGLVNNKNLPYDLFTEKVKEINRKVYWMAEKKSPAR